MAPAALVTGGAARVGRALSLALGRAGFSVAVHYRSSAAAAQEVVAEIRAAGGQAAAVHADLDDPLAPSVLLAAAEAAAGPLSLLVNNASAFHDDTARTFTAEGFQRHMGINLLAPLLLAQGFAAGAGRLDQAADPSIVNILDQRVLRPNPLFFSYALSKAGLHAATTTLAQALAPRIRVNAVAPGPTLRSVHQSEEIFLAEAAGVPLGRPAGLEDIAAAVVFLAGARTVTGQVIAVDSGQHLGWRTPDVAAQCDERGTRP